MWSERYRPKDFQELVGNDAARKKLVAWLTKWRAGGKAAILVGPPGTGKTTTVHLVAEKLGMNLVELNASDTRTRDRLSKRIGEVISSSSLFSEKTLIFLDEVDGLAGRSDYGAIEFIKDAVRKSENPVVMAANDRESDEVRKLSSVTSRIEFERPGTEEVRGLLARVAESEGLAVDEAGYERIARAAHGDLRAAINSLQSGLPVTKEEDLTAAESVNSFFFAHDEKTALRALRSYPGQPREKVRDLFSAVLKGRMLEQRRAAALEALSKADLLMGRMLRGKDWRLLRYFDQMLASELWSAVGDGGVVYTSESAPWPLQLRIWNDSKKLREIASATGKRLGISQRGALVEDLPFILLLCRSARFRDALAVDLGLEENYVTFLDKEAERSGRTSSS